LDCVFLHFLYIGLMPTAAESRARAKRCLDIAAQAIDGEVANAFRILAADYLDLAEAMERSQPLQQPDKPPDE
jgi:hypothetical protein